MRIMVVSNFYPPHAIGGMEYRCQEVVEGLRARGHDVHVLTSTYGSKRTATLQNGVQRLLYLEGDMLHYQPLSFFTRRRRQEATNLEHLKLAISRQSPDIVFIWGMWNLSRSLAHWAEQLCPGRVVYSLAHDWPLHPDMHTSFWREPAHRKLRAPIKKLLGQMALAQLQMENTQSELQFQHVICVSRALRDSLLEGGVPLIDAQVIYPGIDLEDYQYQRTAGDRTLPTSLSLLYAGALSPHKGVHTAIEAMGLLSRDHEPAAPTLSILGAGHPEYVAELHAAAAASGAQESINFLDQVQREQMPAVLKTHDVLVFPSIWEEPLSRIVLEAMAAGLVVTATATGGMKEILVDGVNALLFEPEDAAGLAGLLRRLEREPALVERLRRGGYATAQRFAVKQMIDDIEQYLLHVAQEN